MTYRTCPDDLINPIDPSKDVAEGLTKREHFASMAMQGIVSTYDHRNFVADHNDIARTAVRCADALIEALNNA